MKRFSKRFFSGLITAIAALQATFPAYAKSIDSDYNVIYNGRVVMCYSDCAEFPRNAIKLTNASGKEVTSYEFSANPSHVYGKASNSVSEVGIMVNGNTVAEIPVDVVLRGDVNEDGKVSSADSALIFSEYKKLYKTGRSDLSERGLFAANVDSDQNAVGSNELNAKDASYVFSYAKELYKYDTARYRFAGAVYDEDDFSYEAKEVVRLVNIERAKNGIAPLTLDMNATDAALIRAKEASNMFSHTRPDGRDCFSLLDELGIGYKAAGENIAAGYITPESVVEGWMNSEGHRDNIMNPEFTKIGVGYYYNSECMYVYYWSQFFLK